MTENSKKVFKYLKENYGKPLTANQIQQALGFEKLATVTGSVNGLTRKNMAVRTPTTIEKDGKETSVNYISLTEEGYNFDPDAAAE